MNKYRPAHDDYMLTIYYEGKALKYQLRLYHSDRQYGYYLLHTKSRMIDLKYDRSKKKLTEELLPGQPGLPQDFMKLIEDELKSIVA